MRAGTHADAFSAGVLGADGLCAEGGLGIRFGIIQFYAYEKIELCTLSKLRGARRVGESCSEE